MSEAIYHLFSASTSTAWTVAAGALFLIGLLLIIKGGDIFVDAATWMAEASGVPKFIVGATVVSVATTLPEMIVSFIAAGKGDASMAIGNAIGSVTANTGLIMGLSIIFTPLVIKRGQIAAKGTLLLCSITALLLFCMNTELSLWEAGIVLVIFVLFIAENLYSGAKNKEKEERPPVTGKALAGSIIKFILGAGMLALGSNLLVENGEYLAEEVFGVDPRIVAITLVAIGTSLPELVTAITSLVKKQGAMSVGNIIGANIIDTTIILPVCALISGNKLTTGQDYVRIDMPICLVEIVIAIVPTLILKKFSRWQGILMVAVYLAYIIYSVMTVEPLGAG